MAFIKETLSVHFSSFFLLQKMFVAPVDLQRILIIHWMWIMNIYKYFFFIVIFP